MPDPEEKTTTDAKTDTPADEPQQSRREYDSPQDAIDYLHRVNATIPEFLAIGASGALQKWKLDNANQCIDVMTTSMTSMTEDQVRMSCLGATSPETSRGYQTTYSREFGEIYAKTAAEIASQQLNKDEMAKKMVDDMGQLLGGVPAHEKIKEKLSKNYDFEKDESNKEILDRLYSLYQQTKGETNTTQRLRIVNDMRETLAELTPKTFSELGRVEKLRSKALRAGQKLTHSKQHVFSDKKLRDDTLAKLSGHFGSFKSAKNKRGQAQALGKILDLKIQADALGAPIPPNIKLLMDNTSLVEEIMEHSDDPRARDKLKDALGAAAEKVPDHGSLSELGEGMHQAASGLASHSGDMGLAGGNSGVNISEESNKLMDDMSVSTSPEAIHAREGEQQVASKLMNVKSGVLGADTIGSGTLFEKSMTEVSNRGEFSDWNFGERSGFKQMPVSAQPGEAGFKDIKGLVQGSAAETRGAEFLQERGSRAGAFSGIFYRPSAGVVGEGHLLSEKAGGSRWFDFPGAEDRKQKLDLGIKKEVAGTERPPLSLLGTSGRLGGGGAYMPSQAIQGDVPVPQNQFGSDITQADSWTKAGQHGSRLSSSVHMESLIGSPIGGGPKRKQKDINVQKLNLFGKLPRF